MTLGKNLWPFKTSETLRDTSAMTFWRIYYRISNLSLQRQPKSYPTFPSPLVDYLSLLSAKPGFWFDTDAPGQFTPSRPEPLLEETYLSESFVSPATPQILPPSKYFFFPLPQPSYLALNRIYVILSLP